MTLHTIGTKGTTQLACLPAWSQVLAAADLSAIGEAITDDRGFAALLSGFSAGTSYVLATATTAGTTALTVVTGVSGPPVSQIRPGDLVLGSYADITPGTYVVAASGTTATLSQAARSTGTLKPLAFVRPDPAANLGTDGQLFVPNRGVLRLLPGDVVATDSTGFPHLISANSIAYAGSDWTFT